MQSFGECVFMCVHVCEQALILLCGKYFFRRIIPVCSQNSHPAFSQNYLLLIPLLWSSHLLPLASLLSVSSWSPRVCVCVCVCVCVGVHSCMSKPNIRDVSLFYVSALIKSELKRHNVNMGADSNHLQAVSTQKHTMVPKTGVHSRFHSLATLHKSNSKFFSVFIFIRI